MIVRTRVALAVLLAGTVAAGLAAQTAGTAQAAPTSSRRCLVASVPRPITSGQTSTSQAQMRWAQGANVARYRLHYSPAPYGKWPGYDPHTVWYGRTARLGAVNLPAVASGDKFMNGSYGNPLFAQLQVNNGCNTTIRQSPWVPIWPRAKNPGSAGTGDALAVGSYNVELFPTTATYPVKMTNLAGNIAAHHLDVVALQEASTVTASDLATKLGSDWKVVTAGQRNRGVYQRTGINQQILYRGSRFTETASGILGQGDDDNASTPLPTPWARLTPVDPDPKHRSIVVVSVHLEEPATTSIPAKKLATHNAAALLLRGIAAINQPLAPVIAAGDFKGNFQGYCDERSRPACAGEGQPTFIRSGYLDAQGAVSKVGVAYGTVNKHVANQPANKSGFGGRADFIVARGFTGVARYEVVHRTFGNASRTYQSDHNLITANLFIPFAP